MSGLWEKLFIAITALLVASLVLSGILWQRLGAVENRLTETTAQWQSARNQLQGEDWMGAHYAEVQKQAFLRLGEGPDAQQFVTPDDPAVTAKVQELTGGYSEDSHERWADTERMFFWIMGNIEYAADTYTPVLPTPPDSDLKWLGGFWRYPAETIKDKAGDCEDTTTLMISMLLNYNRRRNPAWGIGIESLTPVPSRHIAVAIPVQNNQLSIVDATAHYYTTFPAGWGIAAKEAPKAIGEWLENWSEKMPEARIYMVFSENLYKEFQNTQEFLDWAKSLNF